MDALVGAVDLVDNDDDAMTQLQRAGKDEARLRHGALGGVDEQDDAVDHLEDTLDLAAEVGMARGIDDVDLGVAVADGGVLGKDGDAALALKVVGVHDAVDDLLIFAVDAALLEHLVDQRGLAVVNVGNDGYVAKLFVLHKLSLLPAARAGNLIAMSLAVIVYSDAPSFARFFETFFVLFAEKSEKTAVCRERQTAA